MNQNLQRKKSLPDVQVLPKAVAPMSREEASVLSSARREEVRKMREESERLRANPFLYFVSPHFKVSLNVSRSNELIPEDIYSFSLSQVFILFFFRNGFLDNSWLCWFFSSIFHWLSCFSNYSRSLRFVHCRGRTSQFYFIKMNFENSFLPFWIPEKKKTYNSSKMSRLSFLFSLLLCKIKISSC